MMSKGYYLISDLHTVNYLVAFKCIKEYFTIHINAFKKVNFHDALKVGSAIFKKQDSHVKFVILQ